MQIPKEWLSVSLGDVVEYGKTRKCELSDVSPDTWVLELEDVERDTSKVIQRLDASQRPFKSTKNRFQNGDILYGKLRPYLNKVILADDDGVCSTEIVPINAAPNVNNHYLFHWLKSETFLNYVKEVSYGVNMPRLGTADGVTAPLLLPPLAEQKVIAEKLDTLLAQVETTKARLERIPQLLKRFRQSVLAAAVSGRLTDEWREITGINIDWDQGIFSDFAEIKHGFAFPSSSFTEDGNAIVMTPGNFSESGTLDFSNKRVVRASEYDRKWVLAAGDLVVVMTDLSQKKLILGVAALIDDKNIYLHNQRIGLVEPMNKKLSKRFLQCVINSQQFKKAIDDTSSGTLIQHTSPKKIGAVPVAIPPIEEQTEIVRRVEQLFAFADTIEQKANAALERVNNLTQSILAKAFKGELTAHWRATNPDLISGENSAEALLKKIKVEREAQLDKPKLKQPTLKKKIGSRMSKQIIKVVEALKLAQKPLSGQQLLAAAGYANDSATDALENFFLDIREALTKDKTIIKLERTPDGQDWFALAELAPQAKV